MKKKFKILYPEDHSDVKKRGKQYKPPKKCMVIMSSSGVFYLANLEPYGVSVTVLSSYLPKYDVVWSLEDVS